MCGVYERREFNWSDFGPSPGVGIQSHDAEPCEGSPFGSPNPVEFPRRQASVKTRRAGVSVNLCDAGKQQPRVGDHQATPLALKVHDGKMRRFTSLANQPRGQQHFALVQENGAHKRSQLAESALRPTVIFESFRNPAFECLDSTEILVCNSRQQVEVQLFADAPSLHQVGLRGSKLATLRMCDPPVREHPLNPEQVLRTTEDRQRRAIVVHRLGNAAQLMAYRAALRCRARPLYPLQIGYRRIDEPQCQSGSPSPVLDVRQGHPRFASKLRGSGPAA